MDKKLSSITRMLYSILTNLGIGNYAVVSQDEESILVFYGRFMSFFPGAKTSLTIEPDFKSFVIHGEDFVVEYLIDGARIGQMRIVHNDDIATTPPRLLKGKEE